MKLILKEPKKLKIRLTNKPNSINFALDSEKLKTVKVKHLVLPTESRCSLRTCLTTRIQDGKELRN